LSGYIAATVVIFIWSSWFVVSRVGAQSVMNIYDMAALRYGISSILSIPIIIYFKPWKTISLKKLILVSMMLGPLYVLTTFAGFLYAPVAHGGIFFNGFVPILTIIISFIWINTKINFFQVLGAIIILFGSSIVLFSKDDQIFIEAWKGDILFFIGAVTFSFYMVSNRAWKITTTEILFSSAFVNGLIYMPIWIFFLPTNIYKAETSEILLQGIFQGVLPNLIGLLLVSYAVRKIGSASTSAFMAAVPSLATFLAFLFIDENIGLFGWISIIILTFGILLISLSENFEN
tara:strand:+ start:988 stop:1854 length:867 start_codon:yes stop_codon:yes gene_type:complete